jgi:hypothetical protein
MWLDIYPLLNFIASIFEIGEAVLVIRGQNGIPLYA